MTGKIGIGFDRKWYSQKGFISGEFTVIQKLLLHKTAVSILRIYRAYAKSTLDRLICRKKGLVFTLHTIFIIYTCSKVGGFEMTRLA